MKKIYIDFGKPSHTMKFEGVYDETYGFIITLYNYNNISFSWKDSNEGIPEGEVDKEIMEQFMKGVNPDKELMDIRIDLQDMVVEHLVTRPSMTTNIKLIKIFRDLVKEGEPMVTHRDHTFYFVNNSLFSLHNGMWFIGSNESEEEILNDLTQ